MTEIYSSQDSVIQKILTSWTYIYVALRTVFTLVCSGNLCLEIHYPWQSGHPRHTVRGIPVGQFLRIRRICSDQLSYEKEARALYMRFLQRGYPRHMLDRACAISDSKNRSELLSKSGCRKKDKKKQFFNKQRPTFSTFFSREFHDIRTIVHQYLPILFEDSVCADLLKDGINFIPRRAPTLGDSLSPSLFDPATIKSTTWLHFKGNYGCGVTGCLCCKHIIKMRFSTIFF